MAVTICQESLLRLYLYEMLSHQESLSASPLCCCWPDLNCYPGNSQNLEAMNVRMDVTVKRYSMGRDGRGIIGIIGS